MKSSKKALAIVKRAATPRFRENFERQFKRFSKVTGMKPVWCGSCHEYHDSDLTDSYYDLSDAMLSVSLKELKRNKHVQKGNKKRLDIPSY